MSNLLLNPSFETASPQWSDLTRRGELTHTGTGPGASAADHWTTFNIPSATTVTDLLPSTRPGGGKQMIHVHTSDQPCGLVQAGFAPHDSVEATAWVFVVPGEVGLGVGNGGSTGILARSTRTLQWKPLKTVYRSSPPGALPATEFIVYGVSLGGACFYVDNAAVFAA